jgi:uncharacterized protein (UPF0332 family)
MLNKKSGSEAKLIIAKLCLDKKLAETDLDFFSVGVSRAYYAIFQATKYLLVKNSFDYKKFKMNNPIAKYQRDYAHGSIGRALQNFLLNNGFNSQDDVNFIKEIHSTFQELYSWRLQGDYEEAVISKKNLEDSIGIAEMFINKLKKYNLI